MTQEAERDAAPQQQEAAAQPEWLVMIYLAGDNNLSPNSIAIMQELIAADPPHADVRVLACFDPNTPRPRGARYVEINRRRNADDDSLEPECWHLHQDLVPFNDLPGHPVTAPDFCNTNPTADQPISEPVAKEGLSRFLKYALDHHPAKKRMLILFGHGSAVAGNTFLADDNPPSFLRLKDFGDVLARHFDGDPSTKKPKLDVLACDNCMMNGLEITFQLRGRVDYILGSQGLMLTLGWPFRKLIRTIVKHKGDNGREIVKKMLRRCARNLVDFSLMDRSSEQAICDLTMLNKDRNIVTLVRRLVTALHEGLEFDERRQLRYPAIRDAVRLARLEAQSYWGETFVDLYDFCELLLIQCNEALERSIHLVEHLREHCEIIWPEEGKTPPPECEEQKKPIPREIKEALLRSDPALKLFEQIANRCWDVMEEIRIHNFVVNSYYVGPELQYSHGVSVYFPWTLPQGPIIFEPSDGTPGGGYGGSYGLSWVSFDRAKKEPSDFILRTPFEEYRGYDFARGDGGDWAAFLERFFRATLRGVRRFDLDYEVEAGCPMFFVSKPHDEKFVSPRDVSLQKSSSSTGDDEDNVFLTIKNYPRRFYLSPADCERKCEPKKAKHDEASAEKVQQPDDKCIPPDLNKKFNDKYCASYLGWNVRGLAASVIGLPTTDENGQRVKVDKPCAEAEPRNPCQDPDSDGGPKSPDGTAGS